MEKISRTFQALLPRSLRMRLLMFLLAAIVLAGAVQGALAYRGALEEADALFDAIDTGEPQALLLVPGLQDDPLARQLLAHRIVRWRGDRRRSRPRRIRAPSVLVVQTFHP